MRLPCRLFTARGRVVRGQSKRGTIVEREEVAQRIKKVVAQVLKRSEDEVTDDANFIFDLGANSMESMQRVAGFEEEFGVELDEDQALNVQTVGEAIEFIKKAVDAKE